MNNELSGIAERGSQKWIQDLVNGSSEQLDRAIVGSLTTAINLPIEWLSPLRANGYAEYRDTAFLECLGLSQHAASLREFWPLSGPRWDALGRTGSTYFLVEAKANIPELISDCQATAPHSREMIAAALRRTQQWLGASPHVDWLTGFYQYANRLAHLYFMREIARVDAYMVFLYILNDPTHIPTSRIKWHGALELQRALLRLGGRQYRDYVISMFLDAADIGAMPDNDSHPIEQPFRSMNAKIAATEERQL
jgi:hypothetical protein